jgi:riboflavin synthase
MFTGIVEETGRLESITPTAKTIQIGVRSKICGRSLKAGDSLAINGCCLTVEKVKKHGRDRLLQFAVLAESWNRTNLHCTKVGSGVNLERPLRANGQMGGHFVSGHVDGTGKITRWERVGKDYVLDVAVPRELDRYMVFKGSIAVDGISLTIAELRKGGVRIWIIPHTYEVTVLHERKVGDLVNLEADLLGKFVERFLSAKKI